MSDLREREIESRLRDFFEADPHGLAAVYLFGSFARGTANRHSDVDVAVLYEKSPPKTFNAYPLHLEEILEKKLDRAVQIVLLNHASPDLRHRVLRDGKLLLDRAPSLRIRFEVMTRNEYFDLQPVLRRYRKLPTGVSKESP